jgi:hypothetical protein
MAIKDVSKIEGEQIETDHEEWPYFRRWSAYNWEQLMGESWESYYFCEDIETEYQVGSNDWLK